MENFNKNMINKDTDDFSNALFINYGGLGDEILFLPAIEDLEISF